MAKLNFTKISQRLSAVQDREKQIKDYKVFYKTYLGGVSRRAEMLNQLYQFCLRFQGINFVSSFLVDKERISLEKETALFLENNFGNSLLSLYHKKIPDPKPKHGIDDSKPFWQNFIIGMSNSFETANEKSRQELLYRKNFLNYLHKCLYDFGLHADILRRSEQTAKRYNICIQHTFKSRKVISEYKLLLQPDSLNAEFLEPYHEKLPIKINGKLLPFKSIYSINITSTLLEDDEIELFAAKNGMIWTGSEENKKHFMHLCKDETDIVSKNPYLLPRDQLLRNNSYRYIHLTRMDELKKVKSKNFDLTKLIQLCEEMNNVMENQNHISVSLLLRSIIDHVPPYFGCANFAEVANNYPGGTRSFKKSMKNLDTSSRNIADNLIHSQMREKEVLPTANQVDFTPELDLLLSEVIRVAK